MKGAVITSILCGFLLPFSAAFQPARRIAPRPSAASPSLSSLRDRLSSRLYSSGEENYERDLQLRTRSNSRPKTSFGAEAVPEEQRPTNEYLELTRQPLFSWADQERGDKGLAVRLGATYVALFALVCYPIAGATFYMDGYFLQKLTSANVGALSVLLVLMVRLFSGWGYIGSRLQSKVIEFEETGWYDGDIEMKTEDEKARDLFLYRSDVKPVEDRLKLFSAAIAVTWLASILAFNVALSNKPYFNEYDPEMLRKLSYDTDVAEVAAQQSGGIPTYCNSRYYRAVAGGNQCK